MIRAGGGAFVDPCKSVWEVLGFGRVYSLETFFLGLLGFGMIFVSGSLHFGIIGETIFLVVMLGGLLGITRIPFPQKIGSRPIPIWAYPLICGIISSFMDSFLVLLLIGGAGLVGSARDQFRFKSYTMLAALIGGLMLYFGEVYMLPLALKYNMRYWHSMLPIVPPVLVFLGVLAWLSRNLDIRVEGMAGYGGEGSHGKKTQANFFDYVEFAFFIGLLLYSHNAVLCLGVLFLYSFVTGQGEELIGIMKTETEVSVMLLLILAAFIEGAVAPFMLQFDGWWAFIPSTVNGVVTGALYPAQGDIWREVCILSTAVLITPVSSLVGVMLFKKASDWGGYIKISVPLALLWFVLVFGWFSGPWKYVEEGFYSVFPKPHLSLTDSSR